MNLYQNCLLEISNVKGENTFFLYKQETWNFKWQLLEHKGAEIFELDEHMGEAAVLSHSYFALTKPSYICRHSDIKFRAK